MSTNFVGKTSLFPSDKTRVPRKTNKKREPPPQKKKKKNLIPCRRPKSAGEYCNVLLSVFSLPALCPKTAQRAACWQLVWHICHYHSFTLDSLRMWHFIPIKGWAASLFSLFWRANLVDHRLMQLSDGAFQCVVWNFGQWKVRYSTCVHVQCRLY